MTTWRSVPLVPGSSYRARSEISSQRDTIRKNQQVQYVNSDYSHYDNLTVLTFIDCQSNAKVDIWWFDNDPIIDWGLLELETSNAGFAAPQGA